MIKIEKTYNNIYLGESPAGANRATRTVLLNYPLFDTLNSFQKEFTILHEKGHILLNTSDEFKADAYAFNKIAGKRFRSLKQAVSFFDEVLDSGNSAHQSRKAAIYKLALAWDAQHGNVAAKQQLTAYSNLDKVTGKKLSASEAARIQSIKDAAIKQQGDEVRRIQELAANSNKTNQKILLYFVFIILILSIL